MFWRWFVTVGGVSGMQKYAAIDVICFILSRLACLLLLNLKGLKVGLKWNDSNVGLII